MLSRILITLMCILSLPAGAEPEQPKTITIVSGETPPYTSQNIKHYGYINHIVSRAFKKMGVTPEFIFMPWSRAYLEAKQGDFDASSYWFEDERHRPHFYFSTPLSQENVVFFKRKVTLAGNWEKINDIKRLQLKMGLTRGYTYTKEIWEYAENRPDLVSVVNTDLQNLKMLVLKRIDVFPVEAVTGWYILNRHFPQEQVQQIEIVESPLMTKTAHLFFPKVSEKSETYLKLFNEGVAKLENSGELADMYESLVMGEYY